ncbi:tyrosine-type recombinase/integrase [Rhodococcus sp. Leaf278]|uniref:tyrosine-type recombinase/integrase n=1 Tax=Rhodococcus sp. Leaf278 TaxID=1736319 RepID=UPI001F47ECC0|nr:site-specific integrase [Rhodococcus sp. Leaf278]
MVLDRATKQKVVRYQVTVNAGVDPNTGNRRQIRRRFRTEKEARLALSETQVAVDQGAFVPRTDVTLREAIDANLTARHGLRESTLAGYRDIIKPVAQEYGHLKVQALTKHHIVKLIAKLRAGDFVRENGKRSRPWGPRSVNLMLTVLSLVLESEQKQGHIARNVATLVDRLPRERRTMDTYTASEVQQIFAYTTGDRMQHTWHLALSGLRRGEVCGLRWKDIDFESGTVSIVNNRVMVGGRVVENPPKTDFSERVLPLTEELVSALTSARKRQKVERHLAGEAYESGEYVVSDELGRPIRPDLVSAAWGRMTVKAGVRKIRFHDARHTCATLMHLEGVPIAVISAWLGHTDASFTMKTYTHSQNPALLLAATHLSAAMSGRKSSDLQ